MKPIYCYLFGVDVDWLKMLASSIKTLFESFIKAYVCVVIPPTYGIRIEVAKEKLSECLGSDFAHHKSIKYISGKWNDNIYQNVFSISDLVEEFDPVIYVDPDMYFVREQEPHVRSFLNRNYECAFLHDDLKNNKRFPSYKQCGENDEFFPQTCFMMFRSRFLRELIPMWEMIWTEYVRRLSSDSVTPFAVEASTTKLPPRESSIFHRLLKFLHISIPASDNQLIMQFSLTASLKFFAEKFCCRLTDVVDIIGLSHVFIQKEIVEKIHRFQNDSCVLQPLPLVHTPLTEVVPEEDSGTTITATATTTATATPAAAAAAQWKSSSMERGNSDEEEDNKNNHHSTIERGYTPPISAPALTPALTSAPLALSPSHTSASAFAPAVTSAPALAPPLTSALAVPAFAPAVISTIESSSSTPTDHSTPTEQTSSPLLTFTSTNVPAITSSATTTEFIAASAPTAAPASVPLSTLTSTLSFLDTEYPFYRPCSSLGGAVIASTPTPPPIHLTLLNSFDFSPSSSSASAPLASISAPLLEGREKNKRKEIKQAEDKEEFKEQKGKEEEKEEEEETSDPTLASCASSVVCIDKDNASTPATVRYEGHDVARPFSPHSSFRHASILASSLLASGCFGGTFSLEPLRRRRAVKSSPSSTSTSSSTHTASLSPSTSTFTSTAGHFSSSYQAYVANVFDLHTDTPSSHYHLPSSADSFYHWTAQDSPANVPSTPTPL